MNLTVKRCLAALVAALILALMPACASFFRYADMRGPIASPHVVERVAPRDPDVPPGIERGAAAEVVWLLTAAMLFVVGILYLVGWGMYELFGAMYRDGRARDYPHAEHSDSPDAEPHPGAMIQTP